MTLLNSPIKIALIAILFVAYADQSTAESWAFLNPQSNCKIRCENGGVCAFQIQNPDVHKCICFVGMYFGDRCQHRTDEPTLTTTPEVVEYTTISTLAPSQAQVREEEDYTSEWKDFNNQILPDESLEEHWTGEDESAEGEDLGEEDRVAEQEYRYGQAVSNGDAEYKEYYHHPRQVQETQHAQTSYEFEAATVSTTTERWASANEPAESQEYVNDDGSEEEGWMMVKRRKTPLNSAPCMSQISLVVAVFIIFNH